MQNYNPSISLNSTHDLASYAKDFFQIIAGSLLLAFSAQIAIPFFPVPLTMQTFAVMLLALCLGKTKATLSVFAYVAESFMGLPVLSHMTIEPLAIVGLRGGYIFGFAVQAFLAGALFEAKVKVSSFKMLVSLVLISALQLLFGTLWLGGFIGWNQALIVGFYPFILGELVKCLLLVSFAKKLVVKT